PSTMLEEVGGAQRRRVEAASHALQLSMKGHGTQRSWAGAAGGKCFAAHHRTRSASACSSQIRAR
ncbi:MAG: hypothetical protein ACM3ZE_26810, partial [Myxococcales bacterium]